MNRGSVKEYVEAIRERYQRCTRREKKGILDQFTEVTGYHRKAAIRLLGRDGSRPQGRRRAASNNRADLTNTLFCLTIAAKPKSLNAPFSWTISFSKSIARSAVCPLSIPRAMSTSLSVVGREDVRAVRMERQSCHEPAGNRCRMPHVTYWHHLDHRRALMTIGLAGRTAGARWPRASGSSGPPMDSTRPGLPWPRAAPRTT